MREMKDSGYQWIREIPTNWKTTKLLYSLRAPITDGPHETPILVDDGIPFISIDSLNDTDKVDLNVCKKFITEELYDIYYKKAKLEKGDILFSKAATIGKTAIVDDELFMVWSPLAIIKADYNKINNRFLYHLLNCKELITNVSLMGSYSTQINVGMRELEKAIIPTPSLDEQKAIASFLDKKCSEIDIITKDIEKQIEVLEDYKKSVITEAVTKGLNPNVEMKDSGIQWIGKVPVEWDIVRLKYIFGNDDDSIKIGPFGSTLKDRTLEFGEYKIYNQAHLISNDFSLNRHFISEESYKALYSYRVNPGDILFSMMGTIGKCRIMPEGYQQGIMDSHLLKARLNDRMIPKYFEYVYDKDNSNVIISQLLFVSKGSIMNGLNSSIVKNVYIPVPNRQEQEQIVSYLDGKCKEIDSLISDKNKQLEILDDYKKSLIYEYVTGKKEVIA